MHWTDNLAERVIKEKKEPYIISAGITTSGPAHLGTVCEFLFPGKIKEALEKRGNRAIFYFIGDIMDAFDGIPISLQQHKKELEQHLGKPLCDVPDPFGTSRSYGDNFLDEVKDLMDTLNVKAEVLRVSDLYKNGVFDKYAKIFLENKDDVKEVVEKTSGREIKNFSPIMPICKKCGRIATTRVTEYKDEKYTYVCDGDVRYTQGCGYEASESIYSHNYKLIWRLHWPCWLDYFNTSIEGAGVDHHTKGGSWDTVIAVFKEIFKKDPPIGFRYGFIMFKGKKYSKSKGIGVDVKELLELIPKELLQYILLKPDLQENIDFVPTQENLLKAYEEFYEISNLEKPTNRADEKKRAAFLLCREKPLDVSFIDVLLQYELLKDWEKVKERFGESVAYYQRYIKNWQEKKFVPDTYVVEYKPDKDAPKTLKEFFKSLSSKITEIEVHNSVFSFAKEKNIPPAELFKQLYITLIGKERGPKFGKLVCAIGIEKIKKDIKS